jgi:hypothetical protein
MHLRAHSRSFFALPLLILAVVWQPVNAQAWNAAGHMIIASLAYDQLSPAAREKWVALLRQHPAFAAWQQTFPKDEPNLEFRRYLFMRASTWPDDIRKSGSPYDHPTWHYIDYPLEMPGCPMVPAPPQTEDILFGLNHSEKILDDPAAAPADRAASLSWIIHLLGDIEQPLHCVTLVNATYPAPDGDRGGNLFFVNMAGIPINLHAVWDSLPGNLLDSQEITQRAQQLSGKFPRAGLAELSTARDPLAWSLEGRALAIDAVYHRGALPGGRDPHGLLPQLPGGYMAASRALADRRLAIGGDRLADTLQRMPVTGP